MAPPTKHECKEWGFNIASGEDAQRACGLCEKVMTDPVIFRTRPKRCVFCFPCLKKAAGQEADFEDRVNGVERPPWCYRCFNKDREDNTPATMLRHCGPAFAAEKDKYREEQDEAEKRELEERLEGEARARGIPEHVIAEALRRIRIIENMEEAAAEANMMFARAAARTAAANMGGSYPARPMPYMHPRPPMSPMHPMYPAGMPMGFTPGMAMPGMGVPMGMPRPMRMPTWTPMPGMNMHGMGPRDPFHRGQMPGHFPNPFAARAAQTAMRGHVEEEELTNTSSSSSLFSEEAVREANKPKDGGAAAASGHGTGRAGSQAGDQTRQKKGTPAQPTAQAQPKAQAHQKESTSRPPMGQGPKPTPGPRPPVGRFHESLAGRKAQPEARDVPRAPGSMQPDPPASKKPEPPASKKSEPPASKKSEPPANKKTEPPAGKKPDASTSRTAAQAAAQVATSRDTAKQTSQKGKGKAPASTAASSTQGSGRVAPRPPFASVETDSEEHSEAGSAASYITAASERTSDRAESAVNTSDAGSVHLSEVELGGSARNTSRSSSARPSEIDSRAARSPDGVSRISQAPMLLDSEAIVSRMRLEYNQAVEDQDIPGGSIESEACTVARRVAYEWGRRLEKHDGETGPQRVLFRILLDIRNEVLIRQKYMKPVGGESKEQTDARVPEEMRRLLNRMARAGLELED